MGGWIDGCLRHRNLYASYRLCSPRAQSAVTLAPPSRQNKYVRRARREQKSESSFSEPWSRQLQFQNTSIGPVAVTSSIKPSSVHTHSCQHLRNVTCWLWFIRPLPCCVKTTRTRRTSREPVDTNKIGVIWRKRCKATGGPHNKAYSMYARLTNYTCTITNIQVVRAVASLDS